MPTERSGWLYENSQDNCNRYVLGEKGDKILVVLGVNPSIAEPDYLSGSDPTVKTVRRLAKHFDLDGWIMLNLYPQRATCPDELHHMRSEPIHKKNLQVIERVLSDYKHATLVAAWGNLIDKRAYLVNCLTDINQLVIKQGQAWKALGINKTGHPKHPLYTKIDTADLIDFNVL